MVSEASFYRALDLLYAKLQAFDVTHWNLVVKDQVLRKPRSSESSHVVVQRYFRKICDRYVLPIVHLYEINLEYVML